MRRIFKHSYAWVLLSIVGGGAVGFCDPELGEKLQPLVDGFISLPKMRIGLIIFCSAVMGITGTGDMNADVAAMDILTAQFTGSGNLLQVLLLAVLFGWAVGHTGIRGEAILKLVASLFAILCKMFGAITKLAFIGAGGATPFTIGRYCVAFLVPLVSLVTVSRLKKELDVVRLRNELDRRVQAELA